MCLCRLPECVVFRIRGHVPWSVGCGGCSGGCGGSLWVWWVHWVGQGAAVGRVQVCRGPTPVVVYARLSFTLSLARQLSPVLHARLSWALTKPATDIHTHTLAAVYIITHHYVPSYIISALSIMQSPTPGYSRTQKLNALNNRSAPC